MPLHIFIVGRSRGGAATCPITDRSHTGQGPGGEAISGRDAVEQRRRRKPVVWFADP